MGCSGSFLASDGPLDSSPGFRTCALYGSKPDTISLAKKFGAQHEIREQSKKLIVS
jgi:hypothetical protein